MCHSGAVVRALDSQPKGWWFESYLTNVSSLSDQFMADHTQSDIELVHSALRPLLMMLGDYRNLNPTLLQRLTHMISLFPTSFNERMCDSLLVRGG